MRKVSFSSMASGNREFDASSLKGKPIIWVMGGPGSGKSTQCERICKTHGYIHLSTGELLRKEVMSGTPRGEQIFKLMQMGDIVCSILVSDLLGESLLKHREAKGFMIDGFPMDIEQAEAFVRDIGPPTKVIFFRANPTVLKGRLISRNNFDDSHESITRRMNTFTERTRPIVFKFNAVVVNAERTIPEIAQEVTKIIENHKI